MQMFAHLWAISTNAVAPNAEFLVQQGLERQTCGRLGVLTLSTLTEGLGQSCRRAHSDVRWKQWLVSSGNGQELVIPQVSPVYFISKQNNRNLTYWVWSIQPSSPRPNGPPWKMFYSSVALAPSLLCDEREQAKKRKVEWLLGIPAISDSELHATFIKLLTAWWFPFLFVLTTS